MTTITFELAEPFRSILYTAYLPEIEKNYAQKFSSWQRVEFEIRELFPTETYSTDTFDFPDWGCRVKMKIPRGNQELFYDRIKEALENLAKRHPRNS